MTTYANTVTSEVGFTGSPTMVLSLTIAEMLGLTDIQAINQLHQIVESLGLGGILDNTIQAQENIIEEIGFSGTYKFIWSIIVTEGLGFNDPLTITPLKYVTLVETIALSGYATTTIQAHNLLQATLGLSDILMRAGLGEIILETLGLNDANVQDLIAAYQKISEDLALNDTLGYVLAMIVSVNETLGLSDTVLTNAHVVEMLQDGINFATSFVYGGETYTGWVMNSENFAVTNYKQYNFTDLAKINGKYYGVQPDGVYLLEGDTDEAEYIKAIIRSGKMDFGTSSKKTLTQAYLGYRADNTIVMKIIADDKLEVFYTLTNEESGLHTERLRLAKGIIGRYWQFEIVTQDTTELDIDTIEFFPLIFKRKV